MNSVSFFAVNSSERAGRTHEIFCSSFFMDLLVMGPGFRGLKDFDFCSVLVNLFDLLRIPRCRPQRLFKIPAVAYAATLIPRCRLQQ
jgi:hypothetical protein